MGAFFLLRAQYMPHASLASKEHNTCRMLAWCWQLLISNVSSLLRINPAKVQDFFGIYYNLKENPANIQDFFTFSAKKRAVAHKSCINAGFFENGNKVGKNDVLLHHFRNGDEFGRAY